MARPTTCSISTCAARSRAGELTLAELREAALHLGGYGNLPRALVLDKAISRAEQALGLPPAECPPLSSDPAVLDGRIAAGEAEFMNVMTFGNTATRPSPSSRRFPATCSAKSGRGPGSTSARAAG